MSEGLRERKRRETKDALSRAAIRLCVQRGWDNVTVDEIAEAANVSPRTFRNYYSTKAEAIASAHLERMRRIADGLRERPVEEPLWTALTHATAAQFEAPEAKGEAEAERKRWMERVRFLFTEPAIRGEVLKASASAREELAKAIAQRARGGRANELRAQLAAATAVSVVELVSERWLKDGATGPMVPALRRAFEMVAAGLPEK